MGLFFENGEQLEELRRAVPLPWEVTEIADPERDGVTFAFPADENLDWDDGLQRPLAEAFYDDAGEGFWEVGHVQRREREGQEVRNYVEVDMLWPLPNDIVDRLKLAAELIVEASLKDIQK